MPTHLYGAVFATQYFVKLALLVQLRTEWYAPFQNPRLPRLACNYATFGFGYKRLTVPKILSLCHSGAKR